jgi:parallel beta-helix repeat protein
MKKHMIGLACCALLLIAIFPVSSTTVAETSLSSQMMGATLYVGGSGPNNYTTIQGAVNAASAGDTVFVYDDSSPYQENLMINRSITLIGEQKHTTVIDGAYKGYSVNITADNVTIKGFTIQNGNDSAIIINSNDNTITDNIIIESNYGIRTSFGQPFGATFQHNTITNNDITNDGAGITFFSGGNITIAANRISHTEEAITLLGARDNNISFNTVTENGFGIWITATYHTLIYRNNITHNRGVGMETFITSADTILQNNFIGNNKSALSYQSPFSKLRIFKIKFNIPIRRNVWSQNYWDRPRLLPYPIPGVFLKRTLQIDWRPALKPYHL